MPDHETAAAHSRADETTRAADGARLPPAANNFGDFIRFLEEGQLDRELTQELQHIAGEMANAAIDSGGYGAEPEFAPAFLRDDD